MDKGMWRMNTTRSRRSAWTGGYCNGSLERVHARVGSRFIFVCSLRLKISNYYTIAFLSYIATATSEQRGHSTTVSRDSTYLNISLSLSLSLNQHSIVT